MSAMSVHFTAAPAAARPTAAIRRASRRSAARVVRRGVVAEAIKEPSTLNTTKSDQVRTTSRPLLMCAFDRGPGSRRSRLVATGPRGARPRRNRRSGIRNRDTIRYPETNNRGPRPRRERARSDPARDTAVDVSPKGAGARISACISAFAGSSAPALVRSIPPPFCVASRASLSSVRSSSDTIYPFQTFTDLQGGAGYPPRRRELARARVQVRRRWPDRV
jgi:hypothetical protein